MRIPAIPFHHGTSFPVPIPALGARTSWAASVVTVSLFGESGCPVASPVDFWGDVQRPKWVDKTIAYSIVYSDIVVVSQKWWISMMQSK